MPKIVNKTNAIGDTMPMNLLMENPRYAAIIPMKSMNVNTPNKTRIPASKLKYLLLTFFALLDKYARNPGYNGKTQGFIVAAIPIKKVVIISAVKATMMLLV